MTSVGVMLRSAREKQGRDMTEIAEGLCITQRYLRAIEQDDLKSLPGVFFYKSFVRQYAATLGVPDGDIQPALDSLVRSHLDPALPGREPARVARPVDEAGGRVRRSLDPVLEALNREYLSDHRVGLSVATLAAVVLACSGFYTWWIRAPRSSARAPVASASAASTTAVSTAAVSTTAAPTGAASMAAATPAATAVQTANDGAGLVLSLAATERVWLSISSGGKEIFSGILQPGETKTLSGLEAARMKVGNAGGIEIQWNGKPVGPLGPSGEVRTVVLTPDNTEILEPNRPSEPSSTL
jgi:cytoskeleton protein RodZ